MQSRAEATRARVLEAAAALFAERGFHGTKMRDIAARARANVASGHYHWGSKKALYLAVLRKEFASIRSAVEERGAGGSPEDLGRLPRRELEARLHARVSLMCDVMIGPPPSLHATLMQREMCDPSEALGVIVDEFIRPMMQELRDILAALDPGLASTDLEHCARSVTGQVVFQSFAMALLLRLDGERRIPEGRAAELADHITAFSLGGVERVATKRRARKPAKRRPARSATRTRTAKGSARAR